MAEEKDFENKDAEDNTTNTDQTTDEGNDKEVSHVKSVGGLYQDWFLDYASYVILERAVPYVFDGLKPVQRRILHSMKRMDDGRFSKVANIIGHTMQFHPHGDAAIGDALVGLGQKDLLIDCQGNWGNIYTGDRAAAPRYIEARLTKFAAEVLFNPKTTDWQASYDGRNKEPICLPVKFPLLLAQGVEGIAVGMASKILPHNFNELLDACIARLQNKPFELYPDFPTAGLVDCSKYNDGLRGGNVRVRARIGKRDNKTLEITELPYGQTTTSLIDSILKANDKGKIKIKKIDDNTAANVEILIHLPNNISPDETIDALYVFSNCELSISPNASVIDGKTPAFIGVSEILKRSVDYTVQLLTLELEIRLQELESDWHKSSLEKIFIQERMYKKPGYENADSKAMALDFLEEEFKPFLKLFRREITRDDLNSLFEIKMGRILKYNKDKADEYIKGIEAEMEEVQNHLDNIIPYSINYYRQIKKKYGKGKERKTEIRSFEQIDATEVVVANTKLYANLKDGFVGTSLKKDEYLFDCSDIDDIIVFRRSGEYVVTKVSDKAFVGKDIIHVGIFRRNDERTVYNAVYHDGKTGQAYMKRFCVTGVTRDKKYDITKGAAGSKVLYFSANPNGEAEIIKVFLKPNPKLRKVVFEIDFSTLSIKGRQSQGNIMSKHPVHKIKQIEEGVSTLGGRKIWFDTTTKRLNDGERGDYLGEFKGSDRILVITKNGQFTLTSFDLSNHYEEEILKIEKFKPGKIFSAIFYDGNQKNYYAKRFEIEDTAKYLDFIGEHDKSELLCLSEDKYPRLEITFGGKHSSRENEIIDINEFIGVKGYKARGKRLTTYEFKKVEFIEPIVVEEEEEEKPQGPKGPGDIDLDGNYNGDQMSLF